MLCNNNKDNDNYCTKSKAFQGGEILCKTKTITTIITMMDMIPMKQKLLKVGKCFASPPRPHVYPGQTMDQMFPLHYLHRHTHIHKYTYIQMLIHKHKHTFICIFRPIS